MAAAGFTDRFVGCYTVASAEAESDMGIEVGGFFGLVLLVLDVWAIVKTVGSTATTGSKVVWIVVILLLPLVGFLLWLLFGPKAP